MEEKEKIKKLFKYVIIAAIICVVIWLITFIVGKFSSSSLTRRLAKEGYTSEYDGRYIRLLDGLTSDEYEDSTDTEKTTESYILDTNTKIFTYTKKTQDIDGEVTINTLYNIEDKVITSYYDYIPSEDDGTDEFITGNYDIGSEDFNCEAVTGDEDEDICDDLKTNTDTLLTEYNKLY